MKYLSILSITIFATLFSCANQNKKETINTHTMQTNDTTKLDTAIFGAGCFWCVETIFQRLQGVEKVSSGYSGGTVQNPSYEEVCNGTTGHAEVTQVLYNPAQISFEELCQVFFSIHNPTQLNRQGHDMGTQYRSAIFYMNDEQKKTAESVKRELDSSKIFDDKVVTEITHFQSFYPAEDYHQNYFNLNKNKNPYCQAVIIPKLEKFLKTYKGKMKAE
ncbi:MAG: peptide-methionine (S)-S-oxide reductase MsrA [Bacteroidota bacterium]|nr:peptide-methionine (S)-S-oxide reductase MsrA [Bacteroidota bacterium]